ncbi:hypothetical protein HGM15179_015877 [Zosterops borbonicus]|uniref:Uncharacterized protein n=1 Tax=Zosterops borbonicus TaxID=364589 RepID=A0A8K1LEV4_9PASS|nr:hypothetical protein HGM15179_015877 [Zosterops borbonicus]
MTMEELDLYRRSEILGITEEFGNQGRPGPQLWRLLEKEHFALGKPTNSGDAVTTRVCGRTQVESLEMAAAAGREKKGGATNASEGVTGQRQFQQPG